MSFEDVTVIVLAGGYSRRFGNKIKALMPYDNTTLLDHLLEKLQEVFDQIVISVASEEIQKEIGETKYPVVVDKHPIPLQSLFEIFEKLTTKFGLIIPIDMPLLTIAHLTTILENINQCDLIANLIDRNWVTSSCFAINIQNWNWKAVKQDLYQRERLTDFIRYPKKIGLITLSDPKMLLNVNTETDFENISKLVNTPKCDFRLVKPKIYIKLNGSRVSNYRTEIDVWKGISKHILSHIKSDIENDSILNSDEKTELYNYIDL